MRLLRRTTLLAVAILIAVISLVVTTAGSVRADEGYGPDPGLTMTVTETEMGVILTLASEDPAVTLTVTLEDDDLDIDVISKDPGVKVNRGKIDDGVTLTATSADGTATLEVIATADSVTVARCTPDYMGEATYG